MTTDTAASPSAITSWFLGRLPDAWSATAPPTITIDREEITVILTVAAPELPGDAGDADRAEAVIGRISGFPRGHPRATDERGT